MTIDEFAHASLTIEHTYRVTQQAYDAFKQCSEDCNPLHTEAGFAQRHGFKGRVMYGNILNCFVSHFVGMLLPSSNVMILAQDIEYHLPIYLNNDLQLCAKVDAVSQAVNAVRYKLRFYRSKGDGKKQTVAKGHVLVKLLKED